MNVAEFIFFLGILIVLYTYIGYGILIWVLAKIRGLIKRDTAPLLNDLPKVTLIVAAYNEAEIIDDKIRNTLAIDYPADLLEIIFITDGSTDSTPHLVNQHAEIKLLHTSDRNGKVEAMHRAMSFVQTPYVVFSDANTLLNSSSIRNIVRHYQNPKVGGVAGEKKIMQSATDAAAAAGEGLYWKYESFLKKMDWQFYTVVGAAGELFSIRTALYEYPGKNILLDDFIISLRICQKGYRVAYEPDAYAMETASSSIREEKKRKIRISAGGFQSMYILRDLLNVFKYPTLSFQYISHRVLRWTLSPLFLPVIFITNIVLAFQQAVYLIPLAAQVIFYALALAGWVLSTRKTSIGFLYAPYYFVFINYSLYLGFFRFLKGKQTVLWEKAAREKYATGEASAGN